MGHYAAFEAAFSEHVILNGVVFELGYLSRAHPQGTGDPLPLLCPPLRKGGIKKSGLVAYLEMAGRIGAESATPRQAWRGSEPAFPRPAPTHRVPTSRE